MELIYLWVENYKNIRNQGFNFSPRFECEFFPKYDKDGKLEKDCELKITPKEYVSIFPDNINVTAIVGENGSGKTTIFNILKEIFIHMELFREPYAISENKIIILFKKKEIDKFEYITNIDGIKIDTKFISNKSNELSINILNYSAEFQKEKNNDNDIVISPNEIAKILTDNFIYKKDFKLSSFMFIPETIKISFDFDFLNKQLENVLEKEKQKIFNQASNVPYEEEKEAEKDMRKSIYNLEDHSGDLFGVDNYYKFLIIWFIENDCFDSNRLSDKDFLLKEYQRQEPNEQISEDELLESFTKKIEDFTDREKEIYFENFHHYFEFDFIDTLGRKYQDLSHGERVLFGQLINIYYYISKSEKSFILNLDEPELSLHPNWQKNYISEIINLLQQFDNEIQLIVTSHSPFILSDLPKENVIFLEKYDEKNKKELEKKYPKLKIDVLENGNCINVTKEIELKTFGANIHTLLSDGFFMSDGLMGEFAKSKITEIKEFYEKVKNSENPKEEHKKEFEDNIKSFIHIQSIIGEPFLQTIIKNYLDDLHIIFSDDKTLIDKELAELEKRKKQLESLKNAKN